MKPVRPIHLALLLLLGLVGSLPAAAQFNRPFSAGQPGSPPAARFNSPETGLLNRAARQSRDGFTEEALLSFDAALAARPNWLPALIGKANLLRRLGRDAQARQIMNQANSIDPLATGFLAARGRNGLLPYLALYPHNQVPMPELTDRELADFSEADYFTQQMRTIMGLPDTAELSRFLRAKVAGDRIASIDELHELMRYRVIPEDLGFMLEGNLDMLNHDYLGAVAAYNQALDFHLTPWPEISYNRGLAFILLDNYDNGCAELRYAARQGFDPAEKMLGSLCNF